MGENGLLAPHRVGRAESKPHDGTIVTHKVNEMWGTDMTQTITMAEGRAYVFVAVEHANSEVVGIHAARSANRFEALEPVRQGVHRCFGSIAPGVARGLMLRHDHGSNYMSGDFQEEIECLGIEASPSFVREPQGNGVAERFIRTLKENLLWARTFDTIEELRAALVEFARHYNETWLVARHGNRTPAQVRAAQSQLDQNSIVPAVPGRGAGTAGLIQAANFRSAIAPPRGHARKRRADRTKCGPTTSFSTIAPTVNSSSA